MPEPLAIRIVSGGQTGVDRAALEVARDLGLSCGGWCPRGRKSEDGRIPDEFEMQETDSRQYSVRTKQWRYTRWNDGEDGEQLFDMQSDPHETTNLAADPKHAAIVARLRRQLEEYPR